MDGFLWSLIGVGVGSGVVTGTIVYLIMRAKIKSLREDIKELLRREEEIANSQKEIPHRYQKPKRVISEKKSKDDKPSFKEESKTSPLQQELEKKEIKKGSENRFLENRGIKIPIKRADEDEKLELFPSIEEHTTLDDLKSLSKAVEEVESLTVDDDIFDDDIDMEEKKAQNAQIVFERGFEETPNIKREDFKKFAGKRVLVAEDNPVNSKLIALLFSKSDIDVEIAKDGVIALEKIEEAIESGEPYDIVLMDVHMPNMDGLEATKKIRADESMKDTVVIALTASLDDDEVKAILGSGMNGFLSKPIKLGKVYSAFEFFLDGKNSSNSKTTKMVERVESSGDIESEVLNIVEGIEHTNHDKSLYKAILNDFLKNYSNSGDKFQDYVQKRDIDSLRSLIIDLEGLSGTIGANELYSIVKHINKFIVNNQIDRAKEYAPSFQNSLNRVLNASELYLNR